MDVQLIRIDARDAMRYGYRFWLDRQSALPLKFQRVSHGGKVLKEIEFISPPLLPDTISEDQLKVGIDTRDFTWVNTDLPMRNTGLKLTYLPQASLLPPGYRVLNFNSQPQDAKSQDAKSDGPRARFIVSDGVSWAEVFLTPATGKARPASGLAMGPMAVYLLRLDDVQVRVMGEMPEAAAKAIAEAVRPE
jgi:sigma-E factor negative regulatory protein RseB